MKKKFIKVKIILLISILFVSFTISAQEFSISNYISSSNNMNIYNIEKVNDGILVFGDYQGTINLLGSYPANGRDMYLIKYNNSYFSISKHRMVYLYEKKKERNINTII